MYKTGNIRACFSQENLSYLYIFPAIGFAAGLLEAGPRPRNGNKSDHAHPPIHPTKYVNTLQVFQNVGI